MDVSVAGLKGGIGKTTSGIHLAAILSAEGKTLLIDADKNQSALGWAKHGKLPFPVSTIEGATKLIRTAFHVVIDTKARPDEKDLKGIAEGCDLLILPTTPNPLDVEAVLKTVDIVESLGANYKVLLTKVPPPRKKPGTSHPLASLKERQVREVLEQASIPTFSSAIYEYSAFQRCPLVGVLVKDYDDPYSEIAWKCYLDLKEEILGHG